MVANASWRYDGSVTGETLTVDPDATVCSDTTGRGPVEPGPIDGRSVDPLEHRQAVWLRGDTDDAHLAHLDTVNP